MYIDRELVINIMDKSDKSYDSNIIAINTLPVDSVFELVIDDIVTAECYDNDKDEMFIFPVDYDYITTTNSKYELERNRLDIEMNISISKDSEYGLLEEKKDNWNNIFRIHDLIKVLSIVILIIVILKFIMLNKV